MSVRLLAPTVGGIDGTPPVDPDEARRAADEILRDGAYAEPAQSLLDRGLEWIFDRLGGAFGTLSGGGPGTGIAWAFVVVFGAAAVWLMIRALRAPGVRRRRRPPDLAYGTETARDARVWLEEADRLAASGDHRGALRCRHQALVAHLVSDGIVPDVAGRTAGEHAQAASIALPQEAARLARITSRFDEVWYADAPVDGPSFDSFASECEAVEASAIDAPNEAVPA